MKLSVKKFSKKSLSLLIALIMVFSALPFTPPISADAATFNKPVGVAGYGVLSSGGRINNNVFEIVNDGRNSNFSIGCVRFNIQDMNYKYEVTSAMYDLEYFASNTDRTKNMTIGFYYPTQNLDTYTLTNGSATNSGTFYSKIFNADNETNHSHVYAAKSYFGLQEITTVESTNDNTTHSLSIDIAPLINYALKNQTTATLMIMFTDWDKTDNVSPWSDRKVTVSTSDFNVTANGNFSTTITANDNANSTTNRVKLGDAIYTRASDSFYNYGKVISTDKFWYTPVTTTSNISTIECLDDGSVLTVSNNKLSGNFFDDKFKVSGNKDVTATLKFTFDDGKIEYHRVAVKSYPVENHAAVQSWKQRTGGNRESGYTLYLRGSTGSAGTGVVSFFNTYYGTYGTDYNDTGTNYEANAIDLINTSVDKKAGIGMTAKGDSFPSSVGVGTYYIDKSCLNTAWANLGNSELWNGSNYSFKMDIVRTMFWNNLGDYGITDTPRNTTGATVSGSYSKSNTTGYTRTYTFTHNASITKASDYNYQYNIQNTDAGSAGMRANIEVNLFDKSVARNLYINYLNENKVSNDYSAESFAAYQNALLDMEAYLSNYENTTNATTSDTVYTNLVNAHNNLKARNYTVTFQRVDDFMNMQTIRTVTVEPGTTVAQSDIPANLTCVYDNTTGNRHRQYYWQYSDNGTKKVFDSTVVINTDIVVSEPNKFVACSGGTATCQALAVCEFCNHTYGSLADHTGGTATCTSKPVCTVCGQEYGETLTHTGGTATCTQGPICELCGEEYGSRLQHSFEINSLDLRPITVAPDGDNNGYKYFACQNCETEDPNSVSLRIYDDQSQYWNTYRDLLTQAKDKIAENNATNGAKYNSDTIDALNEAIARVTKVGDKEKSKTYIENENTILQTAITAVKLNQYSITVKYVDETGADLAIGENGATSKTYSAVNYGSIQNVVAPTSYDGKEYIVYKWTRDSQGNNTISGLNSSSLGVVVKGNLTYYVYLKNATVDSSTANTTAIVKLNNKSNKVVDVGYVNQGTHTVTVSENSFTLTEKTDNNPTTVTLTAPNYSFYTVKGFTVNGKTVTSGSTVQIDAETVIKPVYAPKDTITITVGSDVAGGNVSTSWDSRVKLTSTLNPTDSQIIKWTANINGTDFVWGYGETLSFQATQSCTVRCELISKDKATPSVSVDYVSYNLYKANTITAVSRIAVPDGYTVVEYGTILKTSNNLNSATPSLSAVENATYSKTNTGGVFKATQQITGTNQFAVNFFAATEYKEMYVGAVAYLVYKEPNSNTETTVYSNSNGGKVITSSYNKSAVGN